MMQYDFRLETGDRNAGTVYLPDNPSRPLPVVIHCHGWGGSIRRSPIEPIVSLSKALPTLPAALVDFDFFGCGETGGDYSEMTYGRWEQNLRDITAWVAGQEWADPKKIGGFGISSGTTPLLRYAEQADDLAFVISTASCLGLFMNMPNSPARVLVENQATLLAGGTAEVFGQPFPLEFFLDYVGKAPVYHLAEMRCPVLFLQGKQDNIWRRADAWIGYQSLLAKGLPVKYVEIEGGDHGLSLVPDIVVNEIIAWLGEIGLADLAGEGVSRKSAGR